MHKIIYDSFEASKNIFQTYIDAAVFIFSDMIESFVDRIVFYDNSISEERILEQGTEAIYSYLFLR